MTFFLNYSKRHGNIMLTYYIVPCRTYNNIVHIIRVLAFAFYFILLFQKRNENIIKLAKEIIIKLCYKQSAVPNFVEEFQSSNLYFLIKS